FFSSRRRHTRSKRDWSSDVCSSDLLSRSGDMLTSSLQVRRDYVHLIMSASWTGNDQVTWRGGDQRQRAPLAPDQCGAGTDQRPKIGRASCRERGEGRAVEGGVETKK